MFKRKRKQEPKEKGLFDKGKEYIKLEHTYHSVVDFMEMLEHSIGKYSIKDLTKPDILLSNGKHNEDKVFKISLVNDEHGVYIKYLLFVKDNMYLTRIGGERYRFVHVVTFSLDDRNELMKTAMEYPDIFDFVKKELDNREPF